MSKSSFDRHKRVRITALTVIAYPLNVLAGPVHIGAVAPPQLISLNCWVLSDDSDRVFTVEIARGKSVSLLKKLIKAEKKQRLRDIDADALDLWQASARLRRYICR
jgi:hypothetical protein